jgi:hypothetical protein
VARLERRRLDEWIVESKAMSILDIHDLFHASGTTGN